MSQKKLLSVIGLTLSPFVCATLWIGSASGWSEITGPLSELFRFLSGDHRAPAASTITFSMFVVILTFALAPCLLSLSVIEAVAGKAPTKPTKQVKKIVTFKADAGPITALLVVFRTVALVLVGYSIMNAVEEVFARLLPLRFLPWLFGWDSRAGFYIPMLAFNAAWSLFHLMNYAKGSRHWIRALPQFVLGLFVSFVFVKSGFWIALLFHIAYNAPVFLPAVAKYVVLAYRNRLSDEVTPAC